MDFQYCTIHILYIAASLQKVNVCPYNRPSFIIIQSVYILASEVVFSDVTFLFYSLNTKLDQCSSLLCDICTRIWKARMRLPSYITLLKNVTVVIFNRTVFRFRLASEVFSKSKNLIVLGNLKTSRLPVFSFLIQHKDNGLFLHHNFVSSLLNDLFGIQSRGGCACAGPYAQVFLG